MMIFSVLKWIKTIRVVLISIKKNKANIAFRSLLTTITCWPGRQRVFKKSSLSNFLSDKDYNAAPPWSLWSFSKQRGDKPLLREGLLLD